MRRCGQPEQVPPSWVSARRGPQMLELNDMMGYGGGLGFGLGGWLGFMGCALFVVGAVLLIAWAITRLTGSAQGSAHPAGTAQPTAFAAAPDAMELLRQRFARGEITAEEFASAKQILETAR